MIEKSIIFTVAQGSNYEFMASNLFYSLKQFHPNLQTACISFNKPKYCDYFFNILDICKIRKDVNEWHINHQSYSFKLGIYKIIPKEFLNKFEKIIFYDCDSECLSPISMDDSIADSIFYVPWCQPILTQNQNINKNINLEWAWNGAFFAKHQDFAKTHNIKEWKNVNAGSLVISTKEISNLIDLYFSWTNKIYDFYGKNYGTEELTFSLMMSELDPEYKMPNICENRIGQLCMDESLNNVKLNKKFKYSPWFNSNNDQHTIVNPTCVHFPGEKTNFIEHGKKLYE